MEQYKIMRAIARTQAIQWSLIIFGVFWFLGLMITEPAKHWEQVAGAAYTDTTEPAHGLVQTNPAFEGMESGFSSESIHVTNEYGDYGWEVNECWLTDFIGAAPAAPNALLDGVAHNDTVASAMTRGDVIIGTAGGWDDLAIGANATILTSDGVDAAWAAPVVQTSTLLDGVVHTDTVAQGATLGSIIVADATPDWNELNIGAAGDILTVVGGTAAWAAPAASAWQQIAEASVVVAGANYTARGGGAVVGAAEDVIVVVTCRSSTNSGVAWAALSHPLPVADMVTYYWTVDGSSNLVVHIVNDSSLDVLCTVQYNEL
jgi:hypothetical protein